MKDLKISKELIKNVLVEETENLPDDFTFDIIDNYIIFADDGACMFEVNIYEFAYKCIEWLIDVTDNSVEIITNKDDTYVRIYIPNEADFYSEYATDKIEAIIKVCNRVLEQLNEKI